MAPRSIPPSSKRRPRARAKTAKPARPKKPKASTAAAEKDGRERIMAVAIRSFSQLGYEGTTTAGIARDAGVTQPLIHHHFGSKEGLWRAAMEVLFSDIRGFGLAGDAPPTERLLAAAEQFVRFVAHRPEVTRVITREGASPNPRLTYLVDHYVREPFEVIVGAVRAGQEAGTIAPDVRPDLVLFLLLGAGSHFFDVSALARETLGVDASAARTREDFVALIREVLQRGLFRDG